MAYSSTYWDNRYKNQETAWDLQTISDPLKNYIDQLNDFNSSILIPGCGNAHEAIYLLEKGFTNVTILDYSEIVTNELKKRFEDNQNIKIICNDFFQHHGNYDLIFEQTFLCALQPNQRQDYVKQIKALLKPKGKLVGLLFGKEFGQDFPPFGGTKEEYLNLFEQDFIIHQLELCYNSIKPRQGSEIFVNLQNNSSL